MKLKLFVLIIAICLVLPASIAKTNVPKDFTVAFLGDQGLGNDAVKVNEMLRDSIKNKEIGAIVLLGDLGYGGQRDGGTPLEWESEFNKNVPEDFPVFIFLFNH